MDEGGVAQVVQATLSEDLGTSLEPHGLAKLHTIVGQQLGGDDAQGTQQGPAGVDHLQLAVGLEGGGVSRQAGSVPPIVTGELTCGGKWSPNSAIG